MKVLAATLAMGLLACAFSQAADEPSKQRPPEPSGPRWDGSSRLKSDTTAADLRRRAEDSSAAREKRAEAIFALFANHVKPPLGAAAVGKVLAEATWLKDAD